MGLIRKLKVTQSAQVICVISSEMRYRYLSSAADKQNQGNRYSPKNRLIKKQWATLHVEQMVVGAGRSSSSNHVPEGAVWSEPHVR
jgi:hypothetical protein